MSVLQPLVTAIEARLPKSTPLCDLPQKRSRDKENIPSSSPAKKKVRIVSPPTSPAVVSPSSQERASQSVVDIINTIRAAIDHPLQPTNVFDAVRHPAPLYTRAHQLCYLGQLVSGFEEDAEWNDALEVHALATGAPAKAVGEMYLNIKDIVDEEGYSFIVSGLAVDRYLQTRIELFHAIHTELKWEQLVEEEQAKITDKLDSPGREQDLYARSLACRLFELFGTTFLAHPSSTLALLSDAHNMDEVLAEFVAVMEAHALDETMLSRQAAEQQYVAVGLMQAVATASDDTIFNDCLEALLVNVQHYVL